MYQPNEKIIVLHNCDNCGARIELNGDQRSRQRKNPESKFYCDNACAMQDREYAKSRSSKPREWLKVKHVLDYLPTQEQPEPYVGY